MTNFCFLDYLKNGKPDHISKISKSFLEWFIGFYEGDGYITQWFEKGKLRIAIGIDQKDPALLYQIRTKLGFGRVRKYTRNGQTYWRWILESRENIKRFCYLVNGNLILKHRQRQFQYMLESLKLHDLHTNIEYRQASIRPTLFDGWLSGFCEAECGFDGNFINDFKRGKYSNGSQRYAIKLRFYVTQKLVDDTILQDIGSLLKLKTIRIYPIQNPYQTGSFLYYRLEVNTGVGQDILIKYFEKYPLRGIKRFALIRFIILRRRQIARGSRIESERMAKRTSRLIQFFVDKRQLKDFKNGQILLKQTNMME